MGTLSAARRAQGRQWASVRVDSQAVSSAASTTAGMGTQQWGAVLSGSPLSVSSSMNHICMIFHEPQLFVQEFYFIKAKSLACYTPVSRSNQYCVSEASVHRYRWTGRGH